MSRRLKVPSLKASSSLQRAFGLPICLHPEAPNPLGPTSARVSLFQDIPGPGQAEGFLDHENVLFADRVSFGLVAQTVKNLSAMQETQI